MLTVHKLSIRIHSNQRMTSKRMGRPMPTYTREELRDWLIAQPNFQQLLDAYNGNGCPKELVPSVDRKDNLKSYTLDNIQLVTFKENLKNQKDQNKSGEYLHPGSKGVNQLDMDGVFITSFQSIAQAMRAMTGQRLNVSNIASVCDGKNHSAYGFKWQWA